MNKFAMFFRKNGHKILTFSIGLVFLAGCVFLLWLGGERVYRMFKPENIYEEGVDPDLIWKGAAFDELRASGLKEGSKEYYEQFISNFAKQDFPGFSDPLELNTDYFVSYGIWQAIKVNGQGVYATDKDGIIRIPKADVEKFARYNFDFVGEIKHRDVETGGGFEYDSLSGCYKVSSAMGNSFMVPDVLDVKTEESGEVTLLVDLYYNDGLTSEDVTQDSSKFVKRIKVTMQQTEEMMTINENEVPVVNYIYTSCALVDETVSDGKLPGGQAETEETEETEETDE